jgi:glycosyltransferase involved in cell wall biosynthesis
VSTPLVSVIVASFNGERFLHEALESLFAQDFASYEAVFVDDGSGDRTSEIARSFPVRYLRQENKGLAAARNAGLAAAQGKLITFLDDDDVLVPTKLTRQATFLLEHPETGCVLGRQEWITEDATKSLRMKRDPVFGDPGGIPMASMMIRRSVLEQLGGFDPSFSYAEDRDLLIRLREHGIDIAVLPDVILHRRLHDSNMILTQPEHHPLLRSIKGKLERERSGESE